MIHIGQEEIDESALSMGVDLVAGEFKAHRDRPGLDLALQGGHQLPTPAGQMLLKRKLVAPADHDIDIMVNPAGPAQEKVQGPAAGDIPGLAVLF